jgi:hypothetical protein
MVELYEWVFQLDGIEWVSQDVDLVLCNTDNELVRYTLTIGEFLGLLEHSPETKDSIISLFEDNRSRSMSLDGDTVLDSQYVEI